MRGDPIRHIKYTLPNGRNVYLTNRPDWCDKISVYDFISNTNPSVRFCFCDDYSDTNCSFDLPLIWLPWFTSTPIYPGNVFAFLSLMKKQMSNPSDTTSVWCHCDFSSMRAPTHFGLFLLAEYGEEVATTIEKIYWEEDHRMKNMFGDPVGYAKSSIELDPNIKGLIEAWQAGGENAANNFLQTIKFRI